MKYDYYILKRKIEDIFIYPFIFIGKTIAFLKPGKKEYNIYFFFPFYHTGGAENVHAQIVKATGNSNCIIFFTKKSTDSTYLKQFKESNCEIKDISKYTDNKWLYFLNLIYRGIISEYINTQKNKPIVFNGQCNFGYKISPWINKRISQIELIHSFNSFSWIRLPFLPFINKTIMISKVRIEDHVEQYKNLQVPLQFNSKIQYISNGITLPENTFNKDFNGNLNVLYVGRGSKEKRTHIIAELANKIKKNNPEINFVFVGDVENAIPDNLKQFCILKGKMDSVDELEKIYSQAHILIISSSTEGFPMVVMEAMAQGCAIIATPVGDLPIHVVNNINGQIVTEVNDENKIIEEMKNAITFYHSNREILKKISLNNIHYANLNFNISNFNNAYKQLLKNNPN